MSTQSTEQDFHTAPMASPSPNTILRDTNHDVDLSAASVAVREDLTQLQAEPEEVELDLEYLGMSLNIIKLKELKRTLPLHNFKPTATGFQNNRLANLLLETLIISIAQLENSYKHACTSVASLEKVVGRMQEKINDLTEDLNRAGDHVVNLGTSNDQLYMKCIQADADIRLLREEISRNDRVSQADVQAETESVSRKRRRQEPISGGTSSEAGGRVKMPRAEN